MIMMFEMFKQLQTETAKYIAWKRWRNRESESRPDGAQFYDIVNPYVHPLCATNPDMQREPGELDCEKKYGLQRAPDDMPLEGVSRQWQGYVIAKAKADIEAFEPELTAAVRTMNSTNASIQFYLNVIALVNENMD